MSGIRPALITRDDVRGLGQQRRRSCLCPRLPTGSPRRRRTAPACRSMAPLTSPDPPGTAAISPAESGRDVGTLHPGRERKWAIGTAQLAPFTRGECSRINVQKPVRGGWAVRVLDPLVEVRSGYLRCQSNEAHRSPHHAPANTPSRSSRPAASRMDATCLVSLSGRGCSGGRGRPPVVAEQVQGGLHAGDAAKPPTILLVYGGDPLLDSASLAGATLREDPVEIRGLSRRHVGQPENPTHRAELQRRVGDRHRCPRAPGTRRLFGRAARRRDRGSPESPLCRRCSGAPTGSATSPDGRSNVLKRSGTWYRMTGTGEDSATVV